MKISGLIRLFNHVRSQLQTGLTPGEIEPFKLRVRKIVQDVELICRNHNVGIDSLPAPSRRAYLFLKELDLNSLPLRQDGQPATPTSTVRIKNVVKIGEHFADKIWHRIHWLLTENSERLKLQEELNQQAASIEQICAKHGQTPAVLETPSRRVYCWLKFLTNEDALTTHLESLGRARAITRNHAALADRPLLLHLSSISNLWSRRNYNNVTLLKVHLGFQAADQQVWQSLLQCALGEASSGNEQLFREFAESEEFNEVVFEMESLASPPEPIVRGRAHDLDESFTRVNAEYFGGLMPRPKLNWNRTLTARKFGHYQQSRDTVMISITLDDPAVSIRLIDFVMYHELLHKKHGSMTVNGRRMVHSPAFRTDERQFAGYEQLELELKELALRHRRTEPTNSAEESKI
ncbi:MAG: hypothetical protein KA368_14205 [Acidobacteria bacterium]|nr:hypothetical protein [Acidobacteriota bacterium]